MSTFKSTNSGKGRDLRRGLDDCQKIGQSKIHGIDQSVCVKCLIFNCKKELSYSQESSFFFAFPLCPLRGGPLRGGPLRGGPLRGGPLRGGPLRGGPLWGGPLRGGPLRGGPLLGGPLRGGPLWGGPLRGGPLRGGPMWGVPCHTT